MIDILFEIEKIRGNEEKDLSSTAQLAFCNRVGNAEHQLCTVCLSLAVLTTLQCEIWAWNFMHKIFAIVVKSVGLHLALSLLLLLLLPLLLLPLFACPMKNVGKLCNSISFACFSAYVWVCCIGVCVLYCFYLIISAGSRIIVMQNLDNQMTAPMHSAQPKEFLVVATKRAL